MIKKMLVLVCALVVLQLPARADWKCCFHAPHTVFCDGSWTPKQVADWAKANKLDAVFPIGHYPGIEKKLKEINLVSKEVTPEFVGMKNYLKAWEQLTKETKILFVPGVEYTFSRSHLGIVNITLDLHNRIVSIFEDKALTENQRIKKILELVRGTQALPQICHPTLKYKHPFRATLNDKKIGTALWLTDYTFDLDVWRDEPVVLFEFMNNGNTEYTADLVRQAFGEAHPDKPAIVPVAGCDFHSSKSDINGNTWNRMLHHQSEFPEALKRFTWIVKPDSTDRDLLTIPMVMDELREGHTYLSYGDFKYDPGPVQREIYSYTTLDKLPDIYWNFDSLAAPAMIQVYREDRVAPIVSETLPKGAQIFWYSEQDRTTKHRYIVVMPGHAIAGPYYLEPTLESLLVDAKKIIDKIDQVDPSFRLDLAPSKTLVQAPEKVPVDLIFDKQVDKKAYVHTNVWNPVVGDVLTVKHSQTNETQKMVVSSRLKPGDGIRFCYVIDLEPLRPGNLTVVATCRGVSKSVVITIPDPFAFRGQWKRVIEENASFLVPNNWESSRGARTPLGYGGNCEDGKGTGFFVFCLEQNGQLDPTKGSITRYLWQEVGAGKTKIISSTVEQKNGVNRVTLVWSNEFERNINYGRTIIVRPENSKYDWAFDFWADSPRISPNHQAIFDKIIDSLKPMK